MSEFDETGWIDLNAVVVDFKVEMRAGGKAGKADLANLVSSVNNLTKSDLETLEVGVNR